MIPETVHRPGCADDHRLDDPGDLALALGGDPTSFTGDLLHLVAKADPGNRARLAIAFPRAVRGYELWLAHSPLTCAELLALLDHGPDSEEAWRG